MKLKTEMEVLTTRREHFRNKLDGIDKEMTDLSIIKQLRN